MTKPPNRLIDDDDEHEVAPVSATTLPPRPSVKASPTRTPRSMTGRGPYPGRRQVTAHIDRNLFLGLKAISAQSEKPMVEIFEEALQAYVASVLAQKKFGQS
jgi:hypothetical protein